MSLTTLRCPECNSVDHTITRSYTVTNGANRMIHYCKLCNLNFSETHGTPLAGLRKDLDFIILVLNAFNEGMGLNAVCRTFTVSKNSIKLWLSRLGSRKETLLIYAMCNQFLHQIIEGDELYTKIYKNI